MDIKQIRAKKQDLEASICGMINDFMEETDLVVDHIDHVLINVSTKDKQEFLCTQVRLVVGV